MPLRRIIIIVSLGALIMAPSVALAGRPLITEDAGTVEKGFFEAELSFDYIRQSNHDKDSVPSIQLAYGLTERMELAVGGGYVFRDPAEGSRVNGLGDSYAHLKYRIWGEGNWYPAFTLKPSIKFPAADEDKGLGSGKTDLGATAAFSKSLVGLNLHFDLGYVLIGGEGSIDEFRTGLAWEIEIMKGLIGVGELRYTQNFNSSHKDDPATFLVGVQVPVSIVLFDAAVTFGLNNAAPQYALTIGVTIKFH